MFSVLIPVYNKKIIKLVKAILDQAQKQKIIVEVIAIDDGSRPGIRKENKPLIHAFNVNYVELSENIGRSRVRNWLIKLARYDHLIFLDCDSEIRHTQFLKQYVDHTSHDVVYGGRIYPTSKPRTPKKMLHWKYGTKIESKKADERNKSPFLSFMSNNFMVNKEIIKAHQFNEAIKGYGYEDLVWAHKLKTQGINIFHIDNPVIHTGIEYTDDFLEKTEQALSNLQQVVTNRWMEPTRLIKLSQNLKRYKIDGMFNKVYDLFKEQIEKNIKSKDPNLMLFSFWKLRKILSQD